MAAMPACTCSNANNGMGGDAGMGGDGSVPIGGLIVTPSDVTLDLVSMGAPPTQAFTATYHGAKMDKDVTADATYMLADTTLGVMNANVFTAGTAHGGTTTLAVSYMTPDGQTATGQATIHVRVHGSFTGPNCMGCTPFPPDSAPACAAGVAAQVVYPPDGVVLPPNLNQFEIQYVPGTAADANTVYEIDLENSVTDARIETKCTPAVDVNKTHSQTPGGCLFDLDQTLWTFIAGSNRGGDPIVVSVRASTNGMCASPSTNTMNMSITEQDISGGIYYWKSTTAGAGVGGAIWRKSFGDTTPEEQISPTGLSNFTCLGCHFMSRDGTRMLVSGDDNDSDDEYTDVAMGEVDVATKKFINPTGYVNGMAPGFQTFNHDHSLFLSSNGNGSNRSTIGGAANSTTSPTSNVFWQWKGDTTPATPPFITVGMNGEEPTMPDWSIDDKNVVYVVPTATGWTGRKDDAHVYGGSLWTMPYNGNGMFGAPVEIIKSNGDNNYYPGYSPDGKFIVYNHVPLQGAAATITQCDTTNHFCPNDSFSNPKARVFVLPTAAGAMPVDCERANGSPANAPVDVSNSWPRWSPFIQTYKGSQLLWVTFSSTRDYGLRVRNHVQVAGAQQVQCYPPDSAEAPGAGHGTQFPANCQQPQIWMAAIDLTKAGEFQTAGDPSYPAFWLPFQDITTHNHTAQWTSTVVTQPPPPDGGMCLNAGDDCTANPNGCCGGLVCAGNGKCAIL